MNKPQNKVEVKCERDHYLRKSQDLTGTSQRIVLEVTHTKAPETEEGLSENFNLNFSGRLWESRIEDKGQIKRRKSQKEGKNRMITE